MKEQKIKVRTDFKDINKHDERVYNYCLLETNDKTFIRFYRNLSEPKKVTNTVGTFLNKNGKNSQILNFQSKSDKVTNMVETFLSENRGGFQVITTKTEPKKVTNMVGTFLNKNGKNSQILTFQAKSEKVTNMVETFLSSNDGFYIITTRNESKRLPIRWEPF